MTRALQEVGRTKALKARAGLQGRGDLVQPRHVLSQITDIAGVNARPAKYRLHRRLPVNHDVVRMHHMLTRASHATEPEQKRHQGKVLCRLDNGSMQALCRCCVVLLDVVDDFHQVGGCLLRPTNVLHELFGVLRAWPEPWPWRHHVAGVVFRSAGLLQPWHETIGRSWLPVLRSRTRKRSAIAVKSCDKG